VNNSKPTFSIFANIFIASKWISWFAKT